MHLADGLIDLLTQHVADFGAIGDERWLFTGEGDGPPHQNTVGYWWRKTLRACRPGVAVSVAFSAANDP